MPDVTIKIYSTGKLAGHFAMFMNSDKAKKAYNSSLLAYKIDILEKAEKNLCDRKLHYQIIRSL